MFKDLSGGVKMLAWVLMTDFSDIRRHQALSLLFVDSFQDVCVGGKRETEIS